MVILLAGPDLYRSHQRLRVLRDAFRQKHDPAGFGMTTVDGATMTVDELRSAVSTRGFFGTKRFLAIDPYAASSAVVDVKKLAEFLAPVVKDDETIVVVRQTDASAKATSRVTKRKKTTGSRAASLTIPDAKVENFGLLSPAEQRVWVTAEAKSSGGQISSRAAEMLVAACQGDTWRMATELEKLLAYAGDKSIQPADVEAMVSVAAESNIFGLTDAVGLGQRSLAVKLLHRELAAGVHPLVLLAALASQVRTILIVQAAAGESATVIAQRTGLHPYVVQKSLGQAKRWSADQLRRWHHHLVQIDAQLKSTPLDAETLLDVLLLDRA